MIKYKLTTQELTTYGNFQWKVGEAHQTNGEGKLCGPGWLHYYDHPLVAPMLNPIHANIENPRLWECEAEGEHMSDGRGLKGGCTKMTLLKELPVVKFSDKQMIEVAIKCAQKVYLEAGWQEWAKSYLAGSPESYGGQWKHEWGRNDELSAYYTVEPLPVIIRGGFQPCYGLVSIAFATKVKYINLTEIVEEVWNAQPRSV